MPHATLLPATTGPHLVEQLGTAQHFVDRSKQSGVLHDPQFVQVDARKIG
ncbi:hypothetical protein G4Z16_09710 [Streptomyces bathyalis]|uniref:Uncharacterized protein n=1 Tax=Streptomyces bathyalis TaxID=2710756 RepID=A0A7T1T594_9ACTN|nr:hypothetical protein [Streptomyces bathyalis]QPP06628.1 hypothetical protein G4Z16_09710 [Streptomyces bathyalis]